MKEYKPTELKVTIGGVEIEGFTDENLINIKRCNCSMRIKLVSDGCFACNPEYWEEMLDEDKKVLG